MGIIAAHNQSTEGLRFKVPWVPIIPAVSILANVALMVNLNPMTWVRFAIWMAIGKFVLKKFCVNFQSSNLRIRFRDLFCLWNAPQQGKLHSQFLFWSFAIQFAHRRMGLDSHSQRLSRYANVSDGKLNYYFTRAVIPCRVYHF